MSAEKIIRGLEEALAYVRGEHSPAAPAEDDAYTRAAVRYAEAMLIEGTALQEAEARSAFIKAYREKHGG